jgi:hypothetical protein
MNCACITQISRCRLAPHVEEAASPKFRRKGNKLKQRICLRLFNWESCLPEGNPPERGKLTTSSQKIERKDVEYSSESGWLEKEMNGLDYSGSQLFKMAKQEQSHLPAKLPARNRRA